LETGDGVPGGTSRLCDISDGEVFVGMIKGINKISVLVGCGMAE